LALSVNNILDIYKRQAVSVILDNVSFKYYIIKQYIQSYIKDGGNFIPLASIYVPEIRKLTSTSLNAYMNLTFLDFYSLYSILYANLAEIENLEILSKGKLSFIEYLFKDIYSSIESARVRKTALYGFYEDFISCKNISSSSTKRVLEKLKTVNSLYVNNGILSLPHQEEKLLKPNLHTFSIDCESDFIFTETDLPGISYIDVEKIPSFKSGYVESVIRNENNSSQYVPTVSGTLTTCIESDIKVSVISKTSSVLSIMCGCMDTISAEYQLTLSGNIFSGNIRIWDSEDIELIISFAQNASITTNDSWTLNLKYIISESITINEVFGFEDISEISHVSLKSYSPFNTQVTKLNKVSDRFLPQEEIKKYGQTPFFLNIPVMSSLSKISIDNKLTSSYLIAKNQKLYNRFSLHNNIAALYTDYLRAGVIGFNTINITSEFPISKLSISSNIFDKGSKDIELLYGVIVDFSGSEVEIYFPINDAQIEIVAEIENESFIDIDTKKLIISKLITNTTIDPEPQKLNSPTNIFSYIYPVAFDKWNEFYKYTKSNGKTYIEFLDSKIASTPITAVTPFITIRSIDKVHYSPLIFDFAIELS
jgi:hypothetical protein